MRRFHSYGPVDREQHFCVERRELVRQCTDYLIGNPDKEGHYFTLWGPRQTGKTWLMRQVGEKISQEHGKKFLTAYFSMQGIVIKDDDPEEMFLDRVPRIFLDGFDLEISPPGTWEELTFLFHRRKALFDRPLILFIDEFDSLPQGVIDRLVSLFRDIYLSREKYLLHGLALIGVRAVLGIESESGSPFNIQRSLHVPNLTMEEVEKLFLQYRQESGQETEPAVTEKLCEVTRGQPGLVSWFGELLTEKFNPGKDTPISAEVWEETYRRACTTEWNNTVLNLIKKAEGKYRSHVLKLFTRSDVPFSIRAKWCNYLYLNGIIDYDRGSDAKGGKANICRFSSPFIQLAIYDALTYHFVDEHVPILAVDPLDDLSDVLDAPVLNVPALIRRYRDYLERLKAGGLNPWKDQPRRADMHLTEAVGHFHLYAWLREAVGRYCVVSPEFPTGNGRVDLRLGCGDKEGVIEVKSFTNLREHREAVGQASDYAKKLGLDRITLVTFIPTEDENVLEKLSGEETMGNVRVSVSAIGWT